jgi:hypothetical protein
MEAAYVASWAAWPADFLQPALLAGRINALA